MFEQMEARTLKGSCYSKANKTTKTIKIESTKNGHNTLEILTKLARLSNGKDFILHET